MPNPFVSGGSAPNNATAPVNPVNESSPSVLRQKNLFSMPHQVLDTMRFGEVTPFFCTDAVPNDDLRLRVSTSVNSYTLASPLLSKVNAHKVYMAVPKQAILYNTWTKVFVDPKKGSDVEDSSVRPIASGQFLAPKFTLTPPSELTAIQCFTFVAAVIANHLVYDSDSLLRKLGINPGILQPSTSVTSTPLTYDFIERFYAYLVPALEDNGSDGSLDVTIEGVTYTFHLLELNGKHGFRAFVDFFIDNVMHYSAWSSAFTPLLTAFTQTYTNFKSNFDTYTIVGSQSLFDISRVVAYQMCCAQFISNDDVDDIYTAELYRQNMQSFIDQVTGDDYFVYNGIRIFYDAFAGHYLQNCFSDSTGNNANYDLSGNVVNYTAIAVKYAYIYELLRTRTALRYGDMFNSARTQPLAVGDVTAAVTSSSVSAVDMTIATLTQKFLNLVNSVRNTVRGYSLAVFGVAPDIVPAEPRFISHTQFAIDPAVNVNTSGTDTQGTQNANITGLNQSLEFQSHFNQDSVVVGVMYFYCDAAYTTATDPIVRHMDRFDDFIPQLQNIGDVPVYQKDLYPTLTNAQTTGGTIFGYLPNYYEYKQIVSRATGGFANGALSTWALTRDFDYQSEIELNSEFVRHHPYEFDKFYKSLTGVGSKYFHFIVSSYNDLTAARPMEYVSGVLMKNI